MRALLSGLVFGLLIFSGVVLAQSDRIQWTVPGTSLAAASGGTYRAYPEGDGTTPITLANVTCVASGVNATCSAPRPTALTLGSSFRLTTQLVGQVESAKSDICVLPPPPKISPTPTNLSYIGG